MRVPAKKPSFISGVKSPPWKMVVPNSPQEALCPTGERGRLLLTHVPVMSAPFLPFAALHVPSSLVKVTSSLLFLAHGISDTKGQGGASLSLERRSFPPVFRHPGLCPPSQLETLIMMASFQTDTACPLLPWANSPACKAVLLAPSPLP